MGLLQARACHKLDELMTRQILFRLGMISPGGFVFQNGEVDKGHFFTP